MNKLNMASLKIVRSSGWLLLPLVMLFLLTGYIMDGRYGFSKLLDEKIRADVSTACCTCR